MDFEICLIIHLKGGKKSTYHGRVAFKIHELLVTTHPIIECFLFGKFFAFFFLTKNCENFGFIILFLLVKI